MSLVELDDLTIRFGDHRAVSGVSLQLEPGERFGIIGESGSGKSLTALSIAGLLPDNAVLTGSIRFDGAPLPKDDKAMARLRGKRIGMVFQEPMTALNPLMRIGDQIKEAVDLAGAGGRIDDLLTEVGLQPLHAARYPHQLSGGQRQRAMIAMALASQPDLLIVDEPTSALDVITQRTVLDLIAEVCDHRGMTLLFISHDIRAVASLCSRIGVMRGGELLEVAPTPTLLAQPQAEYTRKLLAASRLERHTSASMPAGAPLLEVDNVVRDYGHGGFALWKQKPLRAVDGVSFTLAAGECLALVGPSGCGKTTLARMIVGLDSVTAGEMRIECERYRGRDLAPQQRASLSLVFQDPFGSFDPRMTIADSIGEPLRLLGPLSKTQGTDRLREAIEAVRLEPSMLDRYPHEFSGGQRQRLAIARALVTRPKLLVLDEPVSALDVSVRGDILRLLARLRAEHSLSYLLISHDLDTVAAMADRVLIMEAGKIVEEGRPDDLFARPQHPLTQALMSARLPEIA